MKWGLIWMILALASMIAPTKAAAEETVVPVAASALIDDDVSGAEKVSDEDLSKERGKFVWAGVEVSLGAEMRTYVNGALVLQTNVSWNAQGAQTTQFVSGALTPVDASRLQSGILTGAGITMHIGDQSVFLANQGQTLLMQRSENGRQN
ncbi:MAG TPA: hypothetical protein VGU01_00860, partial [Sphingomicrobium sp.]|nr:hypothetical protein [Sphingomicrobium sp.]